MVAGIDVLLFKPDAELKRLARLASTPGWTRRSSRAARRRRSTTSSPRATPARLGSRSSRRSRTRGSTWPRATGSTTTTAAGATTRASPTPRSSATWAHSAKARRSNAPPRSSCVSATGSRRSTAPSSTRRHARASTSCSGSASIVFPYVEEHKFLCDYWFLTSWWNKVREFGALLAEHGYLEDAEDVFQLSRTELAVRARRARARLGHGRRAARPEALAADRRASQGDPRRGSRTGLRHLRSVPCPRR